MQFTQCRFFFSFLRKVESINIFTKAFCEPIKISPNQSDLQTLLLLLNSHGNCKWHNHHWNKCIDNIKSWKSKTIKLHSERLRRSVLLFFFLSWANISHVFKNHFHVYAPDVIKRKGENTIYHFLPFEKNFKRDLSDKNENTFVENFLHC